MTIRKPTHKESTSTNLNQCPRALASEATDEFIQEDPPGIQPIKEFSPLKNPAAVALGKLGGKKGGPARAKKLSPERRQEIAKKAARARWAKPS
jgi:hypothetical protein